MGALVSDIVEFWEMKCGTHLSWMRGETSDFFKDFSLSSFEN